MKSGPIIFYLPWNMGSISNEIGYLCLFMVHTQKTQGLLQVVHGGFYGALRMESGLTTCKASIFHVGLIFSNDFVLPSKDWTICKLHQFPEIWRWWGSILSLPTSRMYFKGNKKTEPQETSSRFLLFVQRVPPLPQQFPHHHKHSGETWCKNEITENISGLALGFI